MLPALFETLESRVLLSATSVDADDHAVDPFGNEYHVLAEPDPALSPETTGDFDGTGALADLSQTFFLHSNPGASHTIYLDFDGHITSGTFWNSSYNWGADIITPAMDFEGGALVFTDNELTRIQYVWQRVAEDFLPFDVNVTTEDPGAAALTKSGGSDSAWGIRVVIGGHSSDWYGSAGGVAYYNSFNWDSDTPAFAFADNLFDNEKYMAEAISHEVGHSLGLAHDGTSSVEYYQGHGSGETGWAPILGNSYYKNLTQWSQGEYSGANNTQDDLAMITSGNGFGYRADDCGDTAGSAGSLDVSGTSVSGSGIIETNTDFDVFEFSTGAGTISFTIDPSFRGPNLDILAELYDASGNLVVSANPSSALGASFSVSVAAGTYYLHISGTGQGDPQNGGYSDYASLGAYRIDGTIVGGAEPGPSYFSIAAQNADKSEGDSSTNAYTFVVTRTGDTSQSGSVNYSVAGSGGSAASANDFYGGFASGVVSFAAGETSKTITIYGLGDLNIENDEQFAVTLSNASGANQITTAQATGTIRNDDVPGISVTPTSGLSVDESGATATFSVVLTHPPTADVRISVTSLDLTEGTVNVSELVFTAANWNVAQTVTITGVDDTTRDGNQTFTIRLGPVISADAYYNSLDPTDVTVTNRDNDKGKGGGGSGGGGGGGKGGGGGAKGGPKKSENPIAASDEIFARGRGWRLDSNVTTETDGGDSAGGSSLDESLAWSFGDDDWLEDDADDLFADFAGLLEGELFEL